MWCAVSDDLPFCCCIAIFNKGFHPNAEKIKREGSGISTVFREVLSALTPCEEKTIRLFFGMNTKNSCTSRSHDRML
jgi:hypothetical protein